jgi:phosphoglycerate dehydrogenase-like enzyme
LTRPFDNNKHDLIRRLGVNLTIVDEKEISIQMDFSNIEVLIGVNPFPRIKIEEMSKLKWIQLLSTGINQLTEEIKSKPEIIITNMKGVYSIPIAEWVVGKILDISKCARFFFEKQNEKKWEFNRNINIIELSNKQALLVGTGSVAIETSKRLKPFVKNIIGINTDGHLVKEFDECYPISHIMNILPNSDIVVISLPLTEKTYHLFNYDLMKKIKDNSILINISRGGIIEENDLLKLLNEKKFLGVALDVFENEPLEAHNKLWNFDKLIITPKNSWFSDRVYERRFNVVYQNLINYLNKRKLENIVNTIKGY